MGSAEHGIKIEIKEPRDFNRHKILHRSPYVLCRETTIGDLPEWTKYDVIFNTCLWLSPRNKLRGGIGHRVRAFQPSRALSKIMNPSSSDERYIHIETVLSNKKRNDSTVLYQSPHYEINIKAWLVFGGDTPEIEMEEKIL